MAFHQAILGARSNAQARRKSKNKDGCSAPTSAHAERLFAPLGWTVEAIPIPLDRSFPEWGDSPYADLRLGWSEQGIAINVTVRGKQQAPWCRDSRIDESDGVQIWIDTRNTQNIHRAGRFCPRPRFKQAGLERTGRLPRRSCLPGVLSRRRIRSSIGTSGASCSRNPKIFRSKISSHHRAW